MSDTIEDVQVYDGSAFQSLTTIVQGNITTVEKTSELTNDGEDGVNPFITALDIPDVPDKNLPIDSEDGTVVLDSPSANVFEVTANSSEFSGQIQCNTYTTADGAANDAKIELGTHATHTTGAGGQIRFEPGPSSNNYFRVYDTGSLYGVMACARDTTISTFMARPYKTSVSSNFYAAYNILWDYVNPALDFTNATKDCVLAGFTAPSPICKGDNYYAFNVGGLDTDTDFTLAAGIHLNVASNPDPAKTTYNILVEGTAPSRISSEIQTPKIVSYEDPGTQSSIFLNENLEVLTDGQLTVKPLPTNINQRYVPTNPASVVLKQDLDDKIQVMTQAEYDAIALKDPQILYCITD